MEMARKKRDPKKAVLAKAILEAYQPETAKDMNEPMFEAMLKGEMNHDLEYDSNDKGPKKMIIAETVMEPQDVIDLSR